MAEGDDVMTIRDRGWIWGDWRTTAAGCPISRNDDEGDSFRPEELVYGGVGGNVVH